MGGVLWQDADYGQFLPYVLRLPESWRDGFYTVAALGRDGQNRITDYAVEFYRTKYPGTAVHPGGSKGNGVP